MNKSIAHIEVQKFIAENYKKDLSKLIFKGSPFKEISIQELATQLTGKKKAEKKLPTWFHKKGVLYPPSLNLEQTSSEISAEYKASLVNGNSLFDLTGGFGIDSYFFAQKFERVTYCEQNAALAKLAAHNFTVLGADNIETKVGDGMEFLRLSGQNPDWCYLDPSRRDENDQKIFQLSQCEPNVPEHLNLLLKEAKNILLKTSPLFDLQAGITALKNVHEIHIVGVNNEVKELLWIIKKIPSESINLKTINFKKGEKEEFEGIYGTNPEIDYGPPLTYLYEPNAAIMKSGMFGEIAIRFKLKKLHPNTHLFTSEKFTEFPGRRFEIIETLPFNPKKIKAYFQTKKANIAVRNFPIAAQVLRKQFKLKDGGLDYLFFTTTGKDEKVMLHCRKPKKFKTAPDS